MRNAECRIIRNPQPEICNRILQSAMVYSAMGYGVKLMDNKKKMAAAISAVMNYIKTEEENVRMQPANAPGQAPYSSAPVQLNLWGISGRQAQMQMRNLMQMKGFHGVRINIR